jgi:hypothetical protein
MLSDEKINYLLESMGLDDSQEPSYVIRAVGDIFGDNVVQVEYAGTAADCLQFIAAENYPDDMSFVTMENFDSFDPKLIRLN